MSRVVTERSRRVLRLGLAFARRGSGSLTSRSPIRILPFRAAALTVCARRDMRGKGFEPTKDGPGMRLASLAGPGCDFPGSNSFEPYSRCSRAARSRNAGEGIRTLEPLQERILSPPLLARLSHPRALPASGGAVKPLSDAVADSGSRTVDLASGRSTRPPYQSTESVPSPCGSGAISSSVRRSTTWMTPRSFFAGHASAARTFSARSSSPM